MGVEVERAVVQLRLGVEVMAEALLSNPPFNRHSMGYAALDPALHGTRHLGVVEQVVMRLRPIERQRQELFILPAPACEGRCFPVAIEFLPRIHEGEFRKSGRMDIVAAAAVVVIRVPRIGRGQNRDLLLRARRSDDPWE